MKMDVQDLDTHDEAPGALADGKDVGAKSLRKMAQVLDCFSRGKPTMSVADLAMATNLPRATVHRIVASLRDVGLLDQDGRRQGYRLGLKMFHYGSSVLASLDTPTRAHPQIAKLQQLTGEIVHFHMFDGHQMVCVEHEDMVASSLTTLQAAPTYCTSVGKAFLAFQEDSLLRRIALEGLYAYTPNTLTSLEKLRLELKDIRTRGFAVDNEEIEIGLRCVGAPVRDSVGRVFAAISVSAPLERMPDGRILGLAPVVVQTADEISAALAE